MRRTTIDTVTAVRCGAESVSIFIPPGEVVEVEAASPGPVAVVWRGQRLVAKHESIGRFTRDESSPVNRPGKTR